jgi:hypothetical protein
MDYIISLKFPIPGVVATPQNTKRSSDARGEQYMSPLIHVDRRGCQTITACRVTI